MDPKHADKSSISEIFQQFWSQALGAVSNAEEEVSKVIARLQEGLGWSQEEAVRQVRELSERLTGQRRDVERRMEDAVKQSLLRLRVPRREEVAELSARVEALAKRVESLTR